MDTKLYQCKYVILFFERLETTLIEVITSKNLYFVSCNCGLGEVYVRAKWEGCYVDQREASNHASKLKRLWRRASSLYLYI